MVALAMYLEKMVPGNPKEKLEQFNGLMDNPANQVKFATGAIQRFVQHAEGGGSAGAGGQGDGGAGAGAGGGGDGAAGASRRSGGGKVIDKGHRGVGGQGRAHRKKISVKQVHHAKADPTGKKKPST
jgi:hypothetical protein